MDEVEPKNLIATVSTAFPAPYFFRTVFCVVVKICRFKHIDILHYIGMLPDKKRRAFIPFLHSFLKKIRISFKMNV